MRSYVPTATAFSMAEGSRRDGSYHRRAGENSLTRYGLEEYVADCVILLTIASIMKCRHVGYEWSNTEVRPMEQTNIRS